jgi:hypothetical protein
MKNLKGKQYGVIVLATFVMMIGLVSAGTSIFRDLMLSSPVKPNRLRAATVPSAPSGIKNSSIEARTKMALVHASY